MPSSKTFAPNKSSSRWTLPDISATSFYNSRESNSHLLPPHHTPQDRQRRASGKCLGTHFGHGNQYPPLCTGSLFEACFSRPSDLGLGLELHHRLSWTFSLQRYFSASKINHLADRVFVLWPGVRPVRLRWESLVQEVGPQETSQLHMISNSESSTRDLHLNAKTQLHSTTSKLHFWTPYAKQRGRQEHNPTH